MTTTKPDYLNMRTTNINVRISPLLKSALIEQAATMGLSLSDFIMHVLTTEMSGQKATCPACPELRAKVTDLEAEVQRYEDLAAPFRDVIGQEIMVNGEATTAQDDYDILHLMTQNFRIQK